MADSEIALIGNSEYQGAPGPNTGYDLIYNLNVWPEHYFLLNSTDGELYEFIKDSEAENGRLIVRLTRKIDNKTIRELNNVAYVPIDNKSIVLNSETGLLEAVPEELLSGIATEVKYTSEGRETVNVLFNEDKGIAVDNNKLEVKLHDEALDFSSEGAIKLVFDKETIVLDSEGALAVPYDNYTIKLNSEGKFEAVYEADELKGLHLDGIKFEVKVDDDTVKFNSEGKLVAEFLRYVGADAIEVTSEGIIKALVDGKTIKIVGNQLEAQAHGAVGKDSEGLFVKHDDLTVKVDSEGKLYVPIQVFFEEDSEHVITLDKSAANKVVFGIKHDRTLEVTSEGLHVVAKPVIAGDAIKVTSEGDQDKISVVFDDKTIKLGSEGLFVKVAANQGLGYSNVDGSLKVLFDGRTIKWDSSENALVAEANPLIAVHPIKKTGDVLTLVRDNKTILVDSSEGLYVPIDKDTIILDAGKIKAKKQLNADAITIIENSEVLYANIDEKTIIKDRGFLETAIGGYKDPAVPVVYVNNTGAGSFGAPLGTIFTGTFTLPFAVEPLDSAIVDVSTSLNVGGSSILSTNETGLTVVDYGKIIGITGQTVTGDRFVDLQYNKDTNEVTVRYDVSTITVRNNMSLVDSITLNINGQAATYHPIEARFVPIDNNSIIIRGGKLVTAAPSITAGDGLDYVITPTANILNILTDSESIGIRNDALYIPVLSDHLPAEEDLVLAINSEGKPQFLKRAGVTDVKIDGVSVVSNYEALLPNASNSERGVVKFDNDTLVLNSEGQLKVVNLTEDVLVKELTSEGTSEASVLVNRVAHIDLTPYSKLDETGYRIRLLVDGQEAPSEGVYDSESEYKVTAELYDKAGNLLTTSNVLDLPLEKVLVNVTSRSIPTSEGTSETTLIFHFMDESTIEIPLAAIVSGFITIHGDYVGVNSIYGTKNFEGELMNYGHEVVTQVQFDNKTVRWNDSEIYVEAILPEGRKAMELVDLGASYVYDVKYDDSTVKVNSENELFVPIDEKTIILEGGKVVANIDKRTIIYDASEGHIELPLDEVTIFVNSEGRLEAAGLDVKPGDAIKISTSEEAGLPVKYLDVLYDEATILLNSENELYVPIDKDSIIINSEDELEVHQYTVAEIRALWHAICSEGEA